MAKKAGSAKPRPISAGPVAWLGDYLRRTHQPLNCLMFLLPLLVVYEIGTILYAYDAVSGETRFIFARTILNWVFLFLGVTGYLLPGFLVVFVLLAWHFYRRDRFTFEPRTYLLMGAESVFWSIPLFILMLLMLRYVVPQASGGFPPDATWQAMLVFSIGAGIYEELLFRLLCIPLFFFVGSRLLGAKPAYANYGAIILSSLLFALYHFNPQNPFTLSAFLQYTLGGLYFAGIFAKRGFGIVVGTHACYDILIMPIVLLQNG